jgi:senataxin
MDEDGVTHFEEFIAKAYEDFLKVPEDVHLLCPKISPDDLEDYEDLEHGSETITAEEKKKRVEDGQARQRIAYQAGVILSYPRDKSGVWLANFSARMEYYLQSCDKCVTNWHMGRKAGLQDLSTSVIHPRGRPFHPHCRPALHEAAYG